MTNNYVKLKRKLCYKHHVAFENVRPNIDMFVFRKCDIPETSRDITVEGTCVNGEETELLLDNDTCLNVSTELLQVALSTDMDPVPNLETAIHDGPLALHVTSK